MTDYHQTDPEALRLAAAAPQTDEAPAEDIKEQQDLDALCEQWVRWQATRRFYAPPSKIGSILGQLSGARTRSLRTDGPDAICSAELAAFHMAYVSQPESLSRHVFEIYYVHRVAPIKQAAALLHISRSHFYYLLCNFRKKVYISAMAIYKDHELNGFRW